MREALFLSFLIKHFQILHNDVEIKNLPAGFTDENICIDGFDIQNDLFEIRPSDPNDICITGLFINENQLLVGKNNDQESFWMVGADLSCDDSQMKTDRIVIQNSKVASSICETPGKLRFTTGGPSHDSLHQIFFRIRMAMH